MNITGVDFLVPTVALLVLFPVRAGHLACDGTAELRDGRRFHQCFCGQAGFITGTMKTVEGKRISVEADVVASPNSAVAESQSQSKSIDIALLLPTQGTPQVKG